MRLNLAGDLLLASNWDNLSIKCPTLRRCLYKTVRWLSAILLLDSSLYKTVDYLLKVLTKFASDKRVAYHVFIEQQVVSEVIYYSTPYSISTTVILAGIGLLLTCLFKDKLTVGT